MLYRNEFNDLIYRRESDGKKFLLMEGVAPMQKEKLTYDVIIVFEYHEDGDEDLGQVVKWFYGASFINDTDDLLSVLKDYIG